MYPNQPNQNGYPPAPQPPQPQPPYQPPAPQYGQGGVLPPLNNTNGASGHNPYEFIMNPNSKPVKGGLGGQSFGKQIGLFAGIALVIIIGLAVVMKAFGPKSNTPALLAIAERQQEIIRISTNASQRINAQATGNFVATTNVAMMSSQQQLLTYLAGKGVKPKSKTLALDQSAKTDTLLDNAVSAGNFDTVVTQTLSSQLQTYEGLLQTAYKASGSKTVKALLQQDFDAADALIKQAKSLPATEASSDSGDASSTPAS